MGIEYVNRCGDRYYLLEGKTKTGKPKYYASRKCTGVAVDKMPEGFEFYEHPEQGLVSVRRIRPSQIQASERRQLEAWTLELAGTRFFVVDIQDDCLVVYAPGTDPAESVAAFARILGPFSGLGAAPEEYFGKTAAYHAMLRFRLVDADQRRFSSERWCFRGSIDGWFPLAGPRPLEVQARNYLPHLTKESFFELM